MPSQRAVMLAAGTLCFLLGAQMSLASAQDDDRFADKPVRPVPAVDIARYSGTWFEIARIPNRFQKGCARNTRADYRIVADDRIQVINSCERADGTVDTAHGIARIRDGSSNARLEVSFVRLFGVNLFWGDYWVLGLDSDYQHAFVGTPDRKYGWLLARDMQTDSSSLSKLEEMVTRNGYALSDFVFTIHGFDRE